uniref:Nuclear/hormone receptor activator site AF-1 domain-containing protein n=1 Tax=Knipowitschia caucasica TaxID=637954 RepID=A0AAV2IWS2_KNICA
MVWKARTQNSATPLFMDLQHPSPLTSSLSHIAGVDRPDFEGEAGTVVELVDWSWCKVGLSFRNSSGQVSSSPLGSPTSHRGMHPSLLSPTSMGPAGSLHSPMNGLASPFSVISSPMGPHSMNSPGMGYGPSVSPQVSSDKQ